MPIIIRPEKPEDSAAVERLVRDAFWNRYQPGCSEHLLVRRLRQSSVWRPELSAVAQSGDTLSGMIDFSEGTIFSDQGPLPVLTCGPLAVALEYQNTGIGSALMRKQIEAVRKTDYPAVLLYGDKAYYSRFGFEPGEKYGLTDKAGNFCDALLVLRLNPNIPIAGRYDEGTVFQIQPKDADLFDADFPHREKAVRSSQLFFFPPEEASDIPEFQKTAELQMKAASLLRNNGILSAWESIGAEIRLVGSMRTGLVQHHRDIDLHIYTDELNPLDGFAVMEKIEACGSIKELVYRNLAATDEVCLEWHIVLTGPDGTDWKVDMIQIKTGSAYDGYFEKRAERIRAVLTPKTRWMILHLKATQPADDTTIGIDIVQAVIEGGVQSWDELAKWKSQKPANAINDWIP